MKLLSVSARTDTGSKSVHASQGRIRFMLSNRSECFSVSLTDWEETICSILLFSLL